MITKETRYLVTINTVARQIKKLGGDRVAQDSGVIYAKELMADGSSAATAIEKGVKVGEQIMQRRVENVIPFPRQLNNYFADVLGG